MELLFVFLLPLVLLPQFAAGYLAKQNGRSYWFWFWISFLIPLISLMILLMLEDKSGPEFIAETSEGEGKKTDD